MEIEVGGGGEITNHLWGVLHPGAEYGEIPGDRITVSST